MPLPSAPSVPCAAHGIIGKKPFSRCACGQGLGPAPASPMVATARPLKKKMKTKKNDLRAVGGDLGWRTRRAGSVGWAAIMAHRSLCLAMKTKMCLHVVDAHAGVLVQTAHHRLGCRVDILMAYIVMAYIVMATVLAALRCAALRVALRCVRALRALCCSVLRCVAGRAVAWAKG